ncbi:MAG: metallophosphoesterase [Mesotoga sp.]|jgi:hypothetical protein|uniref:metallophosphoesterase n=1 Tax=unclassified Mesotoga TaxID=1184398 RepID=UPI000FF14DEC|nr:MULTISPECIES: metallophosphoesterase [unclassified Mesotoga]MDI9367126.1 metallophosphoesterase [Thermotogota bacterium]MDD2333070.1 metallophosphoesterase [Mesotoga sp.]MDD3681711.1 metallophosphoesterase [Mesotoga sp.]MDD4207379.1 metallophosphoesterase [Mesotoga sp.]MDD4826632.1 metallophosphoesterase [Mesotoga sp.]
MKWMIMSDSHDNMTRISEAVSLAIDREVDVLFHCGDLVSPFAARELIRFSGELHVVIGNNDGELLGLKSLLGGSLIKGPKEIEVNGYRVILMHEPFGLKDTLRADFIFYGHTHKLDIRLDPSPVIVNPGESCGYLTGRQTVVIIDPNDLKYELIELR